MIEMTENEHEKKNTIQSLKVFSSLLSEISQKKKTKFYLDDFHKHSQCTYYQFGKEPIESNTYFCEICDPNSGEPMCQYCFETCHKLCNHANSNEDDEPKTKINTTLFTCECGKKKHELCGKGDLVMSKSCEFLELDIKLKNKMWYSCPSCGASILCYICYVYCHISQNCKNYRKKINPYEQRNLDEDSKENHESPYKGKRCECNGQNHSSIVIMNTYLTYTIVKSGRFTYDTIPFVWRQQIINAVFDSDIAEKMFYPVVQFMKKSGSDEKKIEKSFINILTKVTLDICTPLTIHFYRFHPKIELMFPFDTLCNILFSIKDKNLLLQADLAKSISSIILKVHLKRDFQNFKNFCDYDFLVLTIFERMAYRKFIATESIYTRKLHEKYFLKKYKNKCILPEFTINIAKMLEKACCIYTTMKSLSRCMIDYFDFWKIIYFSLKRMTYNMESLSKFIEIFEKLSDILQAKLKEIILNYAELEAAKKLVWWIGQKNLYSIMLYFTKITYLLAINYNDLVVEQYLTSEEPHKTLQFLHKENPISKKILKILLSTSVFYTNFLFTQNIYNKSNPENLIDPSPGVKYLNLLNEVIEFYTVSDNTYFKNLEYPNANDANASWKMYETISNFYDTDEDLESQPTENVIDNGYGGSESYDYHKLIVNISSEQPIDLLFKKTIFDLRNKIDGCIELFFLCKISLNALNTNVKSLIEIFGNIDNFQNESSSAFQKIKSPFNPQSKKIKNYLSKLIRDHESVFKFLKQNEFSEQDQEILNLFVEELMFSNIDVLLTNLFMTDPIVANYPLETIDTIFKFLGLFCLTKEGVKYLCLGRNLQRIMKIFNKYQKRTIKFLCLLFRGVYVFEIDISKHKRLNDLMNLIKNYIKIFRVDTPIQEDDFKEFLTFTIKFLKSLVRNLSLEEITIVKKQIFQYVDEKKLLDKEKIKRMFPPDIIISRNNLEENFQTYFNEKDENPLFKNKSKLESLRTILGKDKPAKKEKTKSMFGTKTSDKTILKWGINQFNSEKLSEDLNNDMVSLLPKLTENSNRNKTLFVEKDQINLNSINFTTNEYLSENKEMDNKLTTDVNYDSNNNKESKIINDEKIRKEQVFFFSFIKLITEFTFYFVDKENIFEVINNFNDLDFYKTLLANNYLPLKYRINLLTFLRTIYLSDLLDANDNSRIDKYLDSSNYSKLILQTKGDESKIKERSTRRKEALLNLEILAPRLENLNYMKKVVEIFIQETKNFLLFVFLNPSSPELVDNYLKQILFSIKIIGDVYISYDISSHMTLLFYELAREFLMSINLFKNILNFTRQNKIFDLIDLQDVPSPFVAVMENKEFDIFDSEIIYGFVINGLSEIFQEANLNQNFGLQEFIEKFMDRINKNFTVFCLNDSENYFQDYLVEDKFTTSRTLVSKGSNINLEDDNEPFNLKLANKKISEVFSKNKYLVQTSPDASEESGKINHNYKNQCQTSKFTGVFSRDISIELLLIKNEYLSQFKRSINTALINLLNSISQDIDIDLRQIFVEYCFNQMIHAEKIPNDKFISAILALNKLLLNDGPANQEVIQSVLLKNSLSEIFFSSFHKKLREMMNVSLTVCKDFLSSDRFDQINYKTNVLIKFIKLLGDGTATAMQMFIIKGKSYDDVINNILTAGGSNSNSKNNSRLMIGKGLDQALVEEEKNPNKKEKDELEEKNINEEIVPKLQELIVNKIRKSEITDSIFGLILQSLSRSLMFLDIKKNFKMNEQMPNDKLIVISVNCIICITEYFIRKFRKQYETCYNQLKPNFPMLKEFFFFESDVDELYICKNSKMTPESYFKVYNKFLSKKKLLMTVKIHIINLLLELIEGNAPSSVRYTLISFFHPLDVFEVAIRNFREYFQELKLCKKIPDYLDLDDPHDVDLIIQSLNELYIFDKDFENSLQFKFSMRIFFFLKFFEEVYANPIVLKLFEEIEAIKIIDETHIHLKDNNISEKLNKSKRKNSGKNKNNQEKNKKSNSQNLKSNLKTDNNVTENIEEDFESEPAGIASKTNKICYKIFYLFFSNLLKKIEVKDEPDDTQRHFSYFLIPPVCYLLTTQTKESFYNNVERDSVHAKISSLISESDYFIYEMFYNSILLKNVGTSKFSKMLYNMNMFHLELINYLFIILENILLIVQYNNKNGNPLNNPGPIPFENSYLYTIPTSVRIICIAQIIYLVLLFIFWLKYKFNLYFQHNVMKIYNKKFIIGSVEKYSNSVDSLINNFNTDMGFLTKFKVGIYDAIIANREINIFFFSFLLVILYFLSGCALFLVIPILFIANISKILFGIVKSFTLRKNQLGAIILYTYLVIYLFAWIIFYFYSQSIVPDVGNMIDGTTGPEFMCNNILTCILFTLNYGIRNGGGIGDEMVQLSYENDTSYFLASMVLEITYHLLIILFMVNMLFGVIVDTFAYLRDKNDSINLDMQNVCFICQMNRDEAMKDNIDFDRHREIDHSFWNYVYFLTNLNISNPLNFNSFEETVWSKLCEKDISWIPIYKRSTEGETDDN